MRIAGFIYGGLNPAIQEQLIQHIQSIFPPPIPSQEIVGLALNTLNQDAGVLGIIAIVMAIIGGSGLFVAMEGQFDIIYQIRTRGIIQQYIMALGMLLVFVVLSPLMIFALPHQKSSSANSRPMKYFLITAFPRQAKHLLVPQTRGILDLLGKSQHMVRLRKQRKIPNEASRFWLPHWNATNTLTRWRLS